MNYFKNIITGLFPDRESIENGKSPVYSDVLRRGESFRLAYYEWLAEGDYERTLGVLRDSVQDGGRFPVVRMLQKGVGGFTMDLTQEQIGPDMARFMLEALKDKMKSLDYRMGSTHEEGFLRNGEPHLSERYYLKPRIRSFQPPLEQKYGNVLLELGFYRDQPDFLKCLVTWYSGYDYTPPLPYEDFLAEVFRPIG